MEKPSRKNQAFCLVTLGLAFGLAGCNQTSWTDPQPGRAAAPPPAGVSDRPLAPRGAAPAPVVVWDNKPGRTAQTSADSVPAPSRNTDPQPPPRRRGSSSPPPASAPMPVPAPLPQAPSTDAMTDRFKRDLMSPEVDRMRANDALGNLNPLQQRELFDKQRDLGRIGGPLGY